MRVGLFGGTYNPIHLGHLRAAEEVREQLKLDLIYFIPAASPPHKSQGEIVAAEHRLEMVKIATKGNRHFMVSELEIRRGGRSFTVDTVRAFLSSARPGSDVFVLMGADAFADLGSWKEADELVGLCNIAVHSRPRQDESGLNEPSLAVVRRFGYVVNDDYYVHASGKTLHFLSTTILPISATEIRRKLRSGQSVRYFMPNEVLDYIVRHGLY